MTDPDAIRQDYPPIISSEQLRILLHVSKRRCVWLMQNYIPHTDNGAKTRRYTIRLEDAISFIIEYERSPDSFAASPGQFTSKPYIPPNVDIEALRLTLEDEWYNIPDILDPVTVSRLTNYSDTAVNHWLDKGTLRSALTQNGRVTSKAWLIEFFCGRGMRIAKKNEWHRELLKSAEYE
ncbi:hypothetical protein SAMN02910317_01421 [Ruminococcaceae bacterium FB2012]|nr:hypothetical protein SAMN02910317_01421 [Ruminococcaceae bacterium FB2012]